MNDDQNYFFYPENLSEKALFFGWTGINLVIIAVGLVLSTLIFFFSFVWVPLLITLLYKQSRLFPRPYLHNRH